MHALLAGMGDMLGRFIAPFLEGFGAQRLVRGGGIARAHALDSVRQRSLIALVKLA